MLLAWALGTLLPSLPCQVSHPRVAAFMQAAQSAVACEEVGSGGLVGAQAIRGYRLRRCKIHPSLATTDMQTLSHPIAFWLRFKPMPLSWSKPLTLLQLDLVVRLDLPANFTC